MEIIWDDAGPSSSTEAKASVATSAPKKKEAGISIEWDDAPAKETKTAAKKTKKVAEEEGSQPGFGKQVQGVVQGAGEVVGMIGTGMVGLPGAIYDLATGTDPRLALEGYGRFIDDFNPAKAVISPESHAELAKTYGYRGATAPAKAMEMFGQGVGMTAGWAAALAGADVNQAEKTDAFTQIMSALTGAGLLRPGRRMQDPAFGKTPGKGSAAGIQEQSGTKLSKTQEVVAQPSAKDIAASQKARTTYTKEDADIAGIQQRMREAQKQQPQHGTNIEILWDEDPSMVGGTSTGGMQIPAILRSQLAKDMETRPSMNLAELTPMSRPPLDPRLAAMEAELNPPAERPERRLAHMRPADGQNIDYQALRSGRPDLPYDEQTRTTQGELFTDNRPYTADEATARQFMTEGDVGSRDRSRDLPGELTHTPEQMDRLGRMSETIDFPGREQIETLKPADNDRGNKVDFEQTSTQGDLTFTPKLETIDFETPARELTARGTVGEARAKTAIENGLIKEGIPYSKARVEEAGKQQGDLNFRALRKRQGGVIDMDLLTFGTAKLWEEARRRYPNLKEAAENMMMKFVGTFEEGSVAHALRMAMRDGAKETLVFMSPDDFHKMAMPRGQALYEQRYSERLRESIREGLDTKEGLMDVPFLTVRNGKVTSHEGRHRMDVFKEQGLDVMPVRIRHDSANPQTGGRLQSEDGNKFMAFPKSLLEDTLEARRPDADLDFTKPGAFTAPDGRPAVPKSQRGAIGDWSQRLGKQSAERLKALQDQIGRDYVDGKISFEEYKKRTDPLSTAWASAHAKEERAANNGKLKEVFEGFKSIPNGTKVIATHGLTYTEPTQATVVGRKTRQLQDGLYLLPKVDFGDGRPRTLTPGDIKEVYAPREAALDKLSKVPKGQRGAVGDLNRNIKKKGAAAILLEQKKIMEIEKRPMKQLVAEEGDIRPGIIQDLSNESPGLVGRIVALGEKALTHVLIDKSLAILATSKTGTGKLVHWATSQRMLIHRMRDIRIRDSVLGALTTWRENRKELREMMDIWKPAVGKEALTKENFKTDRQWEVFKAVQDAVENKRQEVNAAREKFGQDLDDGRPPLKPIAKINNYLPAIWEGDYRVWVRDQLGNTVQSFGFPNIYVARKAERALRKAHPDLWVEGATHRKRGAHDLGDLSAFEETLSSIGADHPAYRAVQETYANLISSKGAGRHGLMRKHIDGWIGSEPGKKGVVNAERAIEMYIKRMDHHIANLEIANLKRQLNKDLPGEVREAIPTTMKYLNDYLDISRGADKDKLGLVSDIVRAFARETGFGESSAAESIKKVSAGASLWWLLTPKFLATQTVQSVNAFPKLMQLAVRGEGKNPIASLYMGLQNTFSPDAIAKEARQWATKNEYLDSTLIAMLDTKMSSLSAKPGAFFPVMARRTLGWMETEAVRTPAFLMFEYGLRDAMPNKATRFQKAAELMDYYMVHYDRASSPMMYNEMGVVGEAMRPLKQYAHNAYGQFFEYAANAKNLGEVTPLMTHLATQISVAGLKGMILVAEATALVSLINTIFGSDIRTPEQLIMTNMQSEDGENQGILDALTFGGLSTVLRADVSSSVSAPSLPSMFSSAPVEFTKAIAVDVFTYLYHKAMGLDTPEDEMKAMLAVSPAVMRGFIEELYSEEDGTVPNPNDRMKGNYRRNETEKMMAKFLSLKSIDESKANAMTRITKQLLARDAQQKLDALDAIAGRVMEGKDLSEDLLMRYMREGGSIAELPQRLQKRMIDKQLTYEERQYRGGMSETKRHKLEVMKDTLNKLHPIEPVEEGEFKKMGHPSKEQIQRNIAKSWKEFDSKIKKDDTKTYKDFPQGKEFIKDPGERREALQYDPRDAHLPLKTEDGDGAVQYPRRMRPTI